MIGDYLYFFCLLMMLVATVAGIFRWRIANTADRIISVLLVFTTVSEVIAYIFTVRLHNNMYVYHVFSPLEVSLIGFYYNEAVPVLKRLHTGLIIAIISPVVAVLNAIFVQPPDTFPSLLLLFEGFFIIILSLVSFFSIFYKEDYILVRNAQFWITFTLLIFWSFTFLFWGTYVSFSQALKDKLPVLFKMLTVINFIEYLNFFLIFFFYKKMVRSGE